VLENFQYDKRIRHESPYDADVQVLVKVVSGFFAGAATFECDFEDITHLHAQLEEMYALRATEARLSDSAYGSELCISMKKTGQIEVHGTLNDIESLQYLQFSFFADQTVLMSFLRDLASIIAKLLE
jgi:hypothetical protein